MTIKMKVNQIKIGSILSYVQMGLSIAIGMIYTPVMVRLLGKNEYGLYQTVVSTISVLSILSLGFNASYIRYFSKYKATDDTDNIAKLNGLFLLIFSVIGIIALLCGMFLTFNLQLVFQDGLTIEEYKLARILMFIQSINLAIMFPASVFQSIISAYERFVFLKLIGMISSVVSPLVCLPLLLMGFRSVMLVTISFICSVITYCIYIYYVLKVLNNKFVFYNFEKGIFRNIFIFTGFIAINMIVDQINMNIDKLLLGRFKGTSEVAIYSIGFTIYTYYMLFSTSISGVFTPRIHTIINETEADSGEQKKMLTELFVKVGRLQYLVLGLIASGFVFFGRFFIVNLWAGPEYSNSYIIALLLILPASIALTQNLGIEIQRAENRHHFRSYVYLGMAILNLGLSIILCQSYGAIGSAIGTTISLLIANGLIIDIYYHKRCNIDIMCFWINIASISKGMVIPIIYGILYAFIIGPKTTIVWLVGVLTYTGIYSVSVWHLGMNSYEKSLVKSIVKIIVR